jgi:hypothetical protein
MLAIEPIENAVEADLRVERGIFVSPAETISNAPRFSETSAMLRLTGAEIFLNSVLGLSEILRSISDPEHVVDTLPDSAHSTPPVGSTFARSKWDHKKISSASRTHFDLAQSSVINCDPICDRSSGGSRTRMNV